MNRLFAVTFVVLLSVVPAFAQSPGANFVQLSNGGWVPFDHPSAQTFVVAGVSAQGEPGTVENPLLGCENISPYTGKPECRIGTYRIGKVYSYGPSIRMRVIGLSVATNGVEVVTMQFVEAYGGTRSDVLPEVWSFRNDGTLRPWEW